MEDEVSSRSFAAPAPSPDCPFVDFVDFGSIFCAFEREANAAAEEAKASATAEDGGCWLCGIHAVCWAK